MNSVQLILYVRLCVPMYLHTYLCILICLLGNCQVELTDNSTVFKKHNLIDSLNKKKNNKIPWLFPILLTACQPLSPQL